MALSTYTEFVSDIEGWLDRTNLTARIPDFIKLAEIRLNRALRVSWMSTVYEYTVLSSDNIDFALPSGFNGMRSININNNPNQSLRYVTPENINENNFANFGGKAKFFTILNNLVRIVPPPEENDVIVMLYYQKATPLASMSNETNLFTINAPDALLYGALLEAKPYIKDDKRLKTWSTLYDAAIEQIIADDKIQRWGEQSLEPMSPYSADPIGRVSTG